MNKVEKDSRLWWAMRIRDPIVRQNAISNIEVQPEWDGWYGGSDRPLADMFDWSITPQRDRYRRLLNDKYDSNSLNWADEPIWDKLPDSYYVKNPTPGKTNEEIARLMSLMNNYDHWEGASNYYGVDGGSTLAWGDLEEIQHLQEIPYDQWVELVEKEYGKPKKESNRKKLSFTTGDGLELYEGDKVVWIYKTTVGKEEWVIQHTNTTLIGDSLKSFIGTTNQVFLSKEAADEWIEEQNGKGKESVKYPEYKVGQRVLVHSGANIFNFNGKEGEVVEVNPYRDNAPYIRVKFNCGNYIFCYKTDSTSFNVEIIEDVPLERKWKVGDKFIHYLEPKSKTYFIEFITESEVRIVRHSGTIVNSTYYTISEVDDNFERGLWLLQEPRGPKPEDRVIILTDGAGRRKGEYATLYTKGTEPTSLWWAHKDNGELIILFDGTNGCTKEFEVIIETNTNQTIINQITKKEQNANSKESTNSKDNYIGSIICEEISEIIISGTCSKGKAVFVSPYVESISRGQGGNGASVRS